MKAKKEHITVNWQAYDGYVGGARPQAFNLDSNDIEGDETDADLERRFDEILHEQFLERVTYGSYNREEVLAWMRAQRDEKAKEATQ